MNRVRHTGKSSSIRVLFLFVGMLESVNTVERKTLHVDEQSQTYRCNRKFSPPENLPPRGGRFPRKYSPHPENLPPRGLNLPRKFFPRGVNFPRKIHPRGANFPRKYSPGGGGENFLGNLGNFPPGGDIFQGGKISWNRKFRPPPENLPP